MKERPLLFNGAMVRAILEGRKTQTRTIVKNKPETITALNGTQTVHNNFDNNCPYGQIGDCLWVRETFKVCHMWGGWHKPNESCPDNFEEAGAEIIYADGVSRTVYLCELNEYGVNEIEQGDRAYRKNRFSPSIHMPRWASRITLEITKIRVERLQDITIEDAMAEGCWGGKYAHKAYESEEDFPDFKKIWDSINAKKHPWESNPWVWVIEFIPITRYPTQQHKKGAD